MSQKEISTQELSLHTAKKDAWVAIKGKVYNVSGYLNEHPGGEEILLNVAGRDATADFEDVGHSSDAHEAMEELFVGDLDGYVAPVAKFVFVSKQLQKASQSVVTSGSAELGKPVARIAALVGAVVVGGVVFGANLYGFPLTLPNAGNWGIPGMNNSAQMVVNAIAVASITALSTSAYKFKKTLDLDYEVEHYKPYLKAKELLSGPPRYRSRPLALNASAYNSFQLTHREQLNHNSYRFTFALPHPSDSLELPVGHHVILRANIDDKVVSRSYTPTSRNSDLGKMDLTIKVYPEGAMGNYLLKLPLQERVDVRGPAGRFSYNRFMCEKMVCIAGGSGVTPMLQIIRAVCEDPTDETVVNLLYANQTEDDILVREELEDLATRYACQFSVRFFLDRPPQEWRGGVGFVTAEDIRRYLPVPQGEDVKILICGPPPMVKAMRANAVSLGFTDPGPVSKAGDQVFVF